MNYGVFIRQRGYTPRIDKLGAYRIDALVDNIVEDDEVKQLPVFLIRHIRTGKIYTRLASNINWKMFRDALIRGVRIR